MLRFLLATMILLVGRLQPAPTPSEPISLDNADHIEQLEQIGYGTIRKFGWQPETNQLAVMTTNGIWLYNDSGLAMDSPSASLHQASNTILDAYFSSNETLLAVVSATGDFGIQHVEDNQFVDIQEIFAYGWIPHLAFSHDGTLLATVRARFTDSSNESSPVYIWDTQTGARLHTIETRRGFTVDDIKFSPDGTQLAAAVGDGTAHLWDVNTGEEILNLSIENSRTIEFSPDGNFLAIGTGTSSLGTIHLWDIRTQTELLSFEAHPDVISSLAFSPNGEFLASGSWDHTIKIWSVSDGAEVATLHGYNDSILDIAFSPDGNLLAAGGRDRVARVWDVSTWTEANTLTGFTSSLEALAFNPTNGTLAIGGYGNLLEIWNTQTLSRQFALDTNQLNVRNLIYTLDGATLISEHEYWNINTESAPSISFTQNYGPSAIALSPDGGTLAFGRTDINLLDIATNTEIFNLLGHEALINDMAFSPDGRILASVSGVSQRVYEFDEPPPVDNSIRLWDVSTGTEIDVLREENARVLCLAFNPSGNLLATGSGDTITLWDVNNQSSIVHLTGHIGEIGTLIFSADGSLLISGGADRTIRVWDINSYTEVNILEGHSDAVTDLAFNYDGTMLASASYDGTVRLWGVR